MLENPVRILRRLPAPVQLLVLGTFLNKLGSFIIPYLAIVLRRELLLTSTQAGLLMAAYGVGSIVSILIGGLLTDRLGRRVTLMASLFGSGLLAGAMGLSPSLRVFVVLLLVFGFVADLYRPAASAIVADLLPSSQRVIGFAALRMAVNLGFAVGVVAGGFLADWSWRLLFLGDGATTILYGLTVYFFIPESRPGGDRSDAGGLRPRVFASPWRDGVYLQAMVASFAFALIFFSHVTALPLTVTGQGGYPARVYGLLVGINGLVIAVLEVPLVAWLQRYRRLRLAALGMVVTGAGFALSGVWAHWTWYLVTVLVWTAGEILSSPKTGFIADWSPPESRGRYLSLFQASWSLSFVLNPLLVLPLQAWLGDRRFWPLMMLIALPAAALLLHLDRVADRPERLRGSSDPVATPALVPVGVREG